MDTMNHTTVIAEVGINHNGSLDTARQLVDAAAAAGADLVKFQKRTPELCVPRDQWLLPRDTPWGRMSYIEYKRRMELDVQACIDLCAYARRAGIKPFFSVWDEGALGELHDVAAGLFMFRWPAIKVPSAKATDTALITATAQVALAHQCPLLISTGMSTGEQVRTAYRTALHAGMPKDQVVLMHCHSAYPAPTEELNLRCVEWLRYRFQPSPVGYSGHEFGIEPTVWAVVLGATWVERHITLSHDMWGTDQKASVPPEAFARMVAHIRAVPDALGDGTKRVWPSELPALRKLRGTPTAPEATA